MPPTAANWCEVEWQGKKGFAIATALDTSGRVPSRPRTAAMAGGPPRGYAAAGPPPGYVAGPPPVVHYGPPVYAPYPYFGPWYGPRRYWGYRRWYW